MEDIPALRKSKTWRHFNSLVAQLKKFRLSSLIGARRILRLAFILKIPTMMPPTSRFRWLNGRTPAVTSLLFWNHHRARTASARLSTRPQKQPRSTHVLAGKFGRLLANFHFFCLSVLKGYLNLLQVHSHFSKTFISFVYVCTYKSHLICYKFILVCWNFPFPQCVCVCVCVCLKIALIRYMFQCNLWCISCCFFF